MDTPKSYTTGQFERRQKNGKLKFSVDLFILHTVIIFDPFISVMY